MKVARRVAQLPGRGEEPVGALDRHDAADERHDERLVGQADAGAGTPGAARRGGRPARSGAACRSRPGSPRSSAASATSQVDQVVAHLVGHRDDAVAGVGQRRARSAGTRPAWDGRSSRAGRGRGTCARRPACARAAPPRARRCRPWRRACGRRRAAAGAAGAGTRAATGRRAVPARASSACSTTRSTPSSSAIDCIEPSPGPGSPCSRTQSQPRRCRNAVVLIACRTDPPTDRREISWTARGIPRWA